GRLVIRWENLACGRTGGGGKHTAQEHGNSCGQSKHVCSSGEQAVRRAVRTTRTTRSRWLMDSRGQQFEQTSHTRNRQAAERLGSVAEAPVLTPNCKGPRGRLRQLQPSVRPGASLHGLESCKLSVANRDHYRLPAGRGAHLSDETLHLVGVRDGIIDHEQPA